MTVWPHVIGFWAALACLMLAGLSALLMSVRMDQLYGTGKETKTRVLPWVFILLVPILTFGGMALDLVIGKIHI